MRTASLPLVPVPELVVGAREQPQVGGGDAQASPLLNDGMAVGETGVGKVVWGRGREGWVGGGRNPFHLGL